MANSGLSVPSGSGGLVRYNEEYNSSFKLEPTQVIIFIILIIALVFILKIFFPIK
jgi:preprotein translocase subunit Sec61beta